jgi:hypothetical protein
VSTMHLHRKTFIWCFEFWLDVQSSKSCMVVKVFSLKTSMPTKVNEVFVKVTSISSTLVKTQFTIYERCNVTSIWNILKICLVQHCNSRCEYASKSQKPCWIVVKTMNFFTYVFFLTFSRYVNHSKLFQITNMNVEEFKLKIHLIKFWV